MYFEVISESSKGIRGVSITHGDQSIAWDTHGYSAAAIPDRGNLFKHINELLATLDRSVQKEIFDHYLEMDETLSEIYDIVEIHDHIHASVVKMYQTIPYEAFERYVKKAGNVTLPLQLKEDYTEKDTFSKNYKERTYLKNDYIDLVILTLGLRMMVPIWGSFLSLASNVSGNNFKEQRALELISGSPVDQWPGMERLIVYIESNIMANKSSMSALLGGLSSSEIPDHLSSLAIVRKVALATLDMKDERDNIVKIIYNFVNGSEKRIDNRFEGNVGHKTLHRDGKDDDNSSVFDMIKVNEEIRTDIRITLEEYVNDYERLAVRSYPDVDLKYLEILMRQVNSIRPLDIKLPQTVLSQWVLGNVLSPRSIKVLPVKQQIICIIVSQAILWTKGFHELAVLMTCQPIDLNDNPEWDIDEARGKISRASLLTLESMYPHFRKEARKSEYDKRVVLPAKAIDTIVAELNHYGWRVKAPQALRRTLTKDVNENIKNQARAVKITTQRQLIISYDIKEILAGLVIDLYSI